MSDLCRMMLIHNLLPRVLAYLCTAGDGEEDHNKNDLADELLGLMDADAWHRQERRRTLKCVRFHSEPTDCGIHHDLLGGLRSGDAIALRLV